DHGREDEEQLFDEDEAEEHRETQREADRDRCDEVAARARLDELAGLFELVSCVLELVTQLLSSRPKLSAQLLARRHQTSRSSASFFFSASSIASICAFVIASSSFSPRAISSSPTSFLSASRSSFALR